MKNILFLLGGFLSLTLVSCSDDFFSQTVEIDPPAYEKQLSFHLIMTDKDTVVNLLLSRNYGILETVPDFQNYLVSGGTAEMYKDGQQWFSFTPINADSTFVLQGVLPEPFKSGSTYEIRVHHPDYPEVSAIQAFPGDFTVDSARIKRDAITGQFGDKFDLVDVFLKDPPGVRNYYEVFMTNVFYETSIDPNTGQVDTIGKFEYQVYPEDFSDPNISFGVKGSGLVSDQFFDGQSYKFQAQIYGNGGSVFTVHVRNITEDYYKWSRSYYQKLEAEDNPLVEPVTVFNNLTNGLGIFSLSKERVFEIQ